MDASADPTKELRALLDEINWRCHIVAVVSIGFCTDKSSMSDVLWAVLNRGTWASPQVVGALSLYDEYFLNTALTKIDEYSQIERPSIFSSFFGDERGTDSLSYAGACKAVSALYSILSHFKRDVPRDRFETSRIRKMIKREPDRAGEIAVVWTKNYKILISGVLGQNKQEQ